MARIRKTVAGGIGGIVFFLVGGLVFALMAFIQLIQDNAVVFICIGVFTLVIAAIVIIVVNIIENKKAKLLNEVLEKLGLIRSDIEVPKFDDRVDVKSRQAVDTFSDIKYAKESNSLEFVRNTLESRRIIRESIQVFLNKNEYEKRFQYNYVKSILMEYMRKADSFNILISYVSPVGRSRLERMLVIDLARVDELLSHPEYFMTKTEYNRMVKQHLREELDAKKHLYYDKVNEIIDYANASRDDLIVKSQVKHLDALVQNVFEKTVNSIQRINQIESDEWNVIENYIFSVEKNLYKIVEDDKRIKDFYESEEFERIKETSSLLAQSQREFNEYITEKSQSIMQLFGVRVVRNETCNNDVYNYVRTYKKKITPFTAQVSSNVFGSAENNPISYIIKYFYPYKSKYNEQIEKLRVLIEELETLNEAKIIIENYKKEYEQYVQDVPDYVLEYDESGFYGRLGLATIDEEVLNVEYEFSYTSDGGMAQRSFTVPMNEENISELIYELENRLSLDSLVKEQRALMTSKLRTHIKERDNYTCQFCGNSIYKEPNLLLEVDHKTPVSKGGLTIEENLQTLCWRCNRKKGAKVVI